MIDKSATNVGGAWDATVPSTHRSSIGSTEDDFSENIKASYQFNKKRASPGKESYYASFDPKATSPKPTKSFF